MDLVRPLAVLTPTLDGDVLARLALADAAFTPGQLQRLIPSASVDGIRRALKRLTGQGIVEAVPVGNAAITYGLNRDHVAAGAVVELANLWGTTLDRITAALREWEIPAVYAAVFGSWARHEARADSDLDLFVVRPDDASDDTWAAQIDKIEHRMTRWTGNDARGLVLTETHVRRHPDDPVLLSIVQDGRCVAGTPSWLRDVVHTARGSVTP